jgi:hypothetical protein
MIGKKIAIIGMCLFMITACTGMVIGNAEETENGTSDAGGATSSAGSWYPPWAVSPITMETQQVALSIL